MQNRPCGVLAKRSDEYLTARLIYLTALGGVIHFYWLVKSDVRLPLLYGAILLVLIASTRQKKTS